MALTVLALYGYCLYDFAHTTEAEMPTYNKQVWVLLLVFTNIFYLRAGCSPQTATTHTPSPTFHSGGGGPQPTM